MSRYRRGVVLSTDRRTRLIAVIALVAVGVSLVLMGGFLIQQSDANVQRLINNCHSEGPCAVPAPGSEQPEGMLGSLLEAVGWLLVVVGIALAIWVACSARGRRTSVV